MTDHCSICGGGGFLRVVDDEGNGVLDPNGNQVYRDCLCTIRKRAERQAKALRDASGISDAVFNRLTFDTFRPESAVAPKTDMAEIKRQCLAFAHDPKGWLVLMGPYGTGKTHLAYAIAGELLRETTPVYAASVPDMLYMIRAGIRDAQGMDTEQRIRALRAVNVLILDDWGTEKTTDWANEAMFMVLNARYNERVPTVVTTNMMPEAFRKHDPRLADRILDRTLSRCLILEAGSYRQRRVG